MIRSSNAALMRDPRTLMLSVWFALGALAYACFPGLRIRDPFWGWLPFWLIVAPLVDLVLLHRRRLAVTSRALLIRARRRRRVAPAQARRVVWRGPSDRSRPHVRIRIPLRQPVP